MFTAGSLRSWMFAGAAAGLSATWLGGCATRDGSGGSSARAPVAAIDRAGFEKAHAEWELRVNTHRKGAEHATEWIRMPRAGPNSFSIDHLAVGERIVGIHARHGRECDNFRFLVQRADERPVETKWLNDPGRLGRQTLSVTFQNGEYIVGYRLRHGRNTDSVWFITNLGNEHRIGGPGGEWWVPADGSYVRGPGSNYELVGLDSVAGSYVDGFKGYFRRVFIEQELWEPTPADFELVR